MSSSMLEEFSKAREHFVQLRQKLRQVCWRRVVIHGEGGIAMSARVTHCMSQISEGFIEDDGAVGKILKHAV